MTRIDADPDIRHIGILMFDGVEELDAIGPWEVLAHWTQMHPEDGYTVECRSRDGQPVTANKGLLLGAHKAFADAPMLDVVVVPGGDGRRSLQGDPAFLEWLNTTHRYASLTTSVCTGALVLATAGILEGRPATTHWANVDELGAVDRTIELRPDDRFVDDGDVITAAGASAGIDMALHLIARLASPERAREVRRLIQYDPEPPV